MNDGSRAPRVTVLMTYYNKGAFVAEAVRSVLDQHFTDLELLVVDDASTDGGLDIVRSFEDPRVRILESARNTGRAAAANRGYDRARGTYVAVIDADDRMLPDRLGEQVAFMDAHPEVGVCSSWYRRFGAMNDVVQDPADDATIRASSLFGLRLQYGACMLRRAVVEEHRLRCDEDWLVPGMDFLFLLSIGAHAKYANIAKVLTDYRIGEQNMAHGRDRASDRTALSRETFRHFGLTVSDAELELHMMLHSFHLKPPDAARVKGLRAWMTHVAEWNRRERHFDPVLFEAEMERRWDRIFHGMADRDTGAAIMHLMQGRDRSWGRLRYMMQAAVLRMFRGGQR